MISLLIPTRERPHNVQRLIDSLAYNSNDIKNLQICFYIDSDDVISGKGVDYKGIPYAIVRGERINLSDTYNRIIKVAEHDILMLASDDITIQTKDWDLKVIEAFANAPRDKIILAGGKPEQNLNSDAGVANDCFTHFFIHKNWVKVVGYTCPPYFWADYADIWFNEIATNLNRKVVIDMEIEHHHWINKKAEFDKTYSYRVDNKNKFRPDIVYKNTKSKRDAETYKLQKFIEEHNNGKTNSP
jgi:hypothetical protein